MLVVKTLVILQKTLEIRTPGCIKTLVRMYLREKRVKLNTVCGLCGFLAVFWYDFTMKADFC